MNLKKIKKVSDAVEGPSQHLLQLFKQGFPGEKSLKFGQYSVRDQVFLAVQLDAPEKVNIEDKALVLKGAVRQGNKVLVAYAPEEGDWNSFSAAQQIDLFDE